MAPEKVIVKEKSAKTADIPKDDTLYRKKLLDKLKHVIDVSIKDMKLHGENVEGVDDPEVKIGELKMSKKSIRSCDCLQRNLCTESYLEKIYRRQKFMIRLLVLSAKELSSD